MDAARNPNKNRNFVFPKDIGPHQLLMVFRQYKYEPARKISNLSSEFNSEVVGSVTLPLPRQLMDQTNVRLNRVDLGNAGELAARASAAGHGGIGAAQAAIRGSMPDPKLAAQAIATGFKKALGFNSTFSQEFIDQMNFIVRKSIGAVVDARSIDIGTGAAINPKQALSFEGVNAREFDFDFELMASSPEESDIIRDMSNFIHHHSLPGYRDLSFLGNTALQRVFLEYPSTVDLFLVGVDADHYMHYKTCMIQRFSANKAPTGGQQHAILAGGKPAMVTYNLSLHEIDIRTREDYKLG